MERNPLPGVQQQRPSTVKPGPAPVTIPLAVPVSVGRVRADHQWPARGTKTQLVAPGHRAAVTGTPVTVGGSAGADRVQVSVLDHAAATRAGVSGVLVGLRAQSGNRPVAARGLSFTLSYKAFANAAGANFGQRLHLVSLPSCALTMPDVAACRTQTPLPSTNDSKARTLSAKAPLSSAAAAPTVVAAVAGASGSNGDFTASSLSPVGTWSVGGSSGSFNYNYPVAVPSSATGADVAPTVSLGYSSAAIDGRIASTNNQSGWAGEGWDYTPGYIERTYRTCSDTATAGTPADTGDLCWAGNIVTLNLGGATTSLVRDDTTGTWHAQDDSGQQVQLLTGAANGASNGEYWKITTPDGISYVFGRNTLPGSSTVQTHSALTEPVYYQNASDSSCYSSTFADSKCATNLAWRWNLDYVEDTSGNAAAYYYAKEQGYYGADNGTAAVAYDRASVLDHIDYGLRDVNGSVFAHPATNQVTFASAQRCIPSGTFTCDPKNFNATYADNWPDTPQGQDCAAPPATCNNHAPTFWSMLRLTQIETTYYNGSGYQPVDTYSLSESFPDTGDPELRLDGISRVGHTGTTPATPLVQTFSSELLPNRVPGSGNQGDMYFWRLDQITNEMGLNTQITYGQPHGQDCTASTLPSDPAHDQKLCFPVKWTPLAHSQPILDYFQKYLVTKIVAAPNDNANNSGTGTANRITDYDYYDTPAWHADDNEVVKPANRTYGQFRGYARVGVRYGNTGNSSNGAPDKQTSSITWYYRGLGGTVGDSLSNDTTADNDEYAGLVRETQTFDGANEVNATITDLGTKTTTATRARAGLPDLTANVIVTTKTRAITDEPGISSSATRMLTSTFGYDSIGQQVQETASASDGTPTTCTTTTYATPNAGNTLYVQNRVAEKIVSQQSCPTYGTAPSAVLTDVRTMYDGATTTGGIPNRGLPTEVDTRLDGDTTAHFGRFTATFDTAGRQLSSTTYADSTHPRTTNTAYTPALPTTAGTGEPLAGPLTKSIVTNAKNQTITTTFEPTRSLPTEVVDVAGHKTDAQYDALGRVTSVWKPGQAVATDKATTTYSYVIASAGPSSVTTSTLVDTGKAVGYVSSVSLLNSFGEQIQTQQGAPGGSDVTDYVRDSHGWVIDSRNHWYWQSNPTQSWATEADGSAADRTQTSYDGTGRPVLTTEYTQLTPTWSTQTVYGGNETTVIPPAGGVTQTTVTNARGWTTALRQYTSAPSVNGSTVSGGAHQDTTYGYTALGQQNSVTSASGTSTSTFDRGGRITQQVDPDTGTTKKTWDDAGDLTQTTDAKSQVLTYDYDVLGRKIDEKNGTTLLADWTWDTVQTGQLSYTRRYVSSATIWKVSTDSYDGAGRPLSTTVTLPTSGGETGFAASYQTTYAYTGTGQVKSANMPAGGSLPAETLDYTYDSYSNPTSEMGLTVIVSTANYAYTGLPQQYQLGANNQLSSLTYTYDPQTLRLATQRLDTTAVQAQIEAKAYTYDTSGNLTKTTDQEGNSSAAVETMCYQYTALDQLKQAWSATDGCAANPSTTGVGNSIVGGPQPYWTSWTYLTSGLRNNQVQHGLTTGAADKTTGYTYGVTNHADALASTSIAGGASATYVTDANGNVTSRTQSGANLTVAYDKENRTSSMTGPSATSSYVYDADGNLLIRHDNSTATLYLPGEELTRKNSDNTITGNRFYLFNGTEVAERGSATAANPYFVMADPHGSAQVAAVTVGAGIGPVTRRYLDPFGNPLGSTTGGTWPDSRAFLNKPSVATTAGTGTSAIEDVGAREYDPTTGRFLSADPVLDPTDPQSLNGYDYGDNNPTGKADPSGLHTDGSQYGDREVNYNPDVPSADDDQVEQASPSVAVSNRSSRGGNLARSFSLYAQKQGYRPGYFRSSWANSYNEANTWASFCDTSGSELCGPYLRSEWDTISNQLEQLPENVKLQTGQDPESLIDLGLTQLEIDDAPQGPRIVYRGGGRTASNFTPRPDIDDTGLSTFDSIEAGKAAGVFKPGAKVHMIDTSKFQSLGVHADNSPPGHVSIRPGELSEILEWADTRGTDSVHPFTQEILDSIIGSARVPE